MLWFIIAFGSALILVILFSPLAKWIAFKFGILDRPGSRKIHDKPTPLLGGVAIYLSFAVTAAMFLYMALDMLYRT